MKTKMQFTSLEAYQEILPKLGEKQRQVIQALEKVQPATDFTLSRALDQPINRITPRRNELVEKNLVEFHDITIQNGRKANRWRIKAAPGQTSLF